MRPRNRKTRPEKPHIRFPTRQAVRLVGNGGLKLSGAVPVPRPPPLVTVIREWVRLKWTHYRLSNLFSSLPPLWYHRNDFKPIFQGAAPMEWTSPQHEEIDLNCEVSSYANAEL